MKKNSDIIHFGFTEQSQYFVRNKRIIFMSIIVGKIDLGSVRLNFWDLGGQEELQSLWDKVSILLDLSASPYRQHHAKTYLRAYTDSECPD